MAKKSLVRLSGAVYTPPEIAAALISVIKEKVSDTPVRILEPSVGDGVFLNKMVTTLSGGQFTVIDIDDEVINELDESNKPVSVEYVIDDYINYASIKIKSFDRPFDLIIGNPPFIRKHNFSDEFKQNLKDFSALTEYPLQDLKNSWAAFIIASSRILSEVGILAFIVPYELLTVEYGKKALTALRLEFECIDIFVSKEKAFPEIEQDAVIFIGYKKSKNKTGLYINYVENFSDLSEPEKHKLNITNDNEQALELNAFLIPTTTLEFLRELRLTCPRIQDFAGSAPGIVSAANGFFILKKSQVQELGFENYVIPILKKGSLVSHKPTFTNDDFLQIEKNDPCYLLDIKEDFEALDKNLQAYIKAGEKKGLHLRYKCRNRKNWYDVPIVPREEGFFFKRSYEFPQFCLNDANVFLTDTAYGLRLKGSVTIRGLCYSFYNSLTMLFAEIDGRFYGGGVLELSPKEFRGLPLVYHEPTEEEFEKFLDVHSHAEGDVEEVLDYGDNWLREKMSFNNDQMVIIRQAWSLVRAHRMRHSGRKASKHLRT